MKKRILCLAVVIALFAGFVVPASAEEPALISEATLVLDNNGQDIEFGVTNIYDVYFFLDNAEFADTYGVQHFVAYFFVLNEGTLTMLEETMPVPSEGGIATYGGAVGFRWGGIGIMNSPEYNFIGVNSAEGLLEIGEWSRGEARPLSELFTNPAPPTPPDSKPSLWAEVEVNAAIAAGLVPQGLQGNYQGDVSRGDVAAMFISLIEKVCDQTIDDFMAAKGVEINDGAFTDTADRAVLAANALGIINGVGDSKFDPGGTLKRAQIAAIINRAARALDINTEGYTHSFSDVEGHWSDAELGWPASLGIINGYEDGTFRPEGNLTTEQAIAITYRAFSVLTQDGAEQPQGILGGSPDSTGSTGNADSQYNKEPSGNTSADLASVIAEWTEVCKQIIGDTDFDGFLNIVKALEETDNIMQIKYFVLHIPKDMNTIMAGELLQATLYGYGVEFALHIYDNPPPPGSAEVYIEIP